MEHQIDILNADLPALINLLQSLDPSYDWHKDDLSIETARAAIIDNIRDFGADERVRVGTGYYHYNNRVFNVGVHQTGWLAMVETAADGAERVAIYPVTDDMASRQAIAYRDRYDSGLDAGKAMAQAAPADLSAIRRHAERNAMTVE